MKSKIANTYMRSLPVLALCFVQVLALGQNSLPEPGKSVSVLISGATIHVGNGTVIENGKIGFKAGKITEVGTSVTDASVYDFQIDASGKHIYPGFILPNTILGLTEVDAVRATRDFNETGEMNPSARSLVGYNTDSKIIPTIRSNGVLYCQPSPRGGLISGTSSVMMLDGWNWEDAALKRDDGIWLNWPAELFRTGWWGEPGEDEPNKKRKEDLEKIKHILQRAKAAEEGTDDLNLAALKPLFNGKKNLYVNVSRAKEIREAVLFFKELGVKNIVISGGEESYLVADFLKTENVPVLLDRLHSLPFKSDDAYDLPYELPKKLKDAGVLYALSYSGNMEAMGSRNLPFLAGTSVRFGLTKEEALMSITLNTAKILGIDDRCGSLEPGKDASLFISTGDALDVISNQVEMAFIQGRLIRLSNHQTELYERYKAKYGLK